MSKLATKQDMLRAKLPTRDVEAGAFGTVRLRKFSASRRIAISSKYAGDVKGDLAMQMCIEVIAESVIDEVGNQMFTLDEAQALVEKDYDDLIALMKEAMDLNGFGRDVVDDAKKNSEQTTNSPPPTGSAKPSDAQTQAA